MATITASRLAYVAQDDNFPMSLAVESATHAPAHTAGDPVPPTADKDNGGVRVHIANPSDLPSGVGTQYDEGDTDATATGVVALGKTSGNAMKAVLVEGDGTIVVNPTALAATTDSITAKIATDAIQNGVTALTPKFALDNVAASATDDAVIAAVASKKLRVLSLAIVCGATATNITFNSKPAGAGTAISCLFANAANGGVVLPFNPVGWFETASGEGLSCTTGAGATTGIQVTYVEV